MPESAGIYKMLDKNKKILYIGKAKNLKKRISSYFNKQDNRLMIKNMLPAIADIEFIITGSEKEALILENNLIKRYKPFYNLDLKDNKTFPYLKITCREDYPRIIKTRVYNKKGIYFGPYTDVSLLHKQMEVIKQYYAYKKCKKNRFSKNDKPCLYYHMGQCPGVCTGKISKTKYKQTIDEICSLLKGNTDTVIKELEKEMKYYAREKMFEKAIRTRDKIQALKTLAERQYVSCFNNKNFDVINYFISEETLIIAHLLFRNGKLINKITNHFTNKLFHRNNPAHITFLSDAINEYLIQYYKKLPVPVKEVYLPFLYINTQSTAAIINDIFSGQNHNSKPLKTKITFPVKGEKKRLLELAGSNARISFFQLQNNQKYGRRLIELRNKLKLKRIPRVIEAFDIANTGLSAVVAGMVRYVNAEKDKKNYRVFNIKTVTNKPDDYKAVKEAVLRRYQRLISEKKKLPDLILIDGGKGQLTAAGSALDRLNIKGQPVIAIAKKKEQIFVPKKDKPLDFAPDSPALKYLIQIRDETHRFTNSRHINKRDKTALKSILNQIKGIGPAKRQLLLNRFKTIDSIKKAELNEVAALPYFSTRDFQRLQRFFSA